MNQDRPDKPTESSSEDVAEQLKRYSAQLAKLFKELSESAPVGTAASGAERAQNEARKKAIHHEVRRLTQEMNDLRNRTGHWKEKPPPTDEAGRARRADEEEELRLRKELGRVADAQVALVADWNADPSAAKKAAFEREYRRLADEYAAIHSELKRVREKLGKDVTPAGP